jgi:hypothetical protein
MLGTDTLCLQLRQEQEKRELETQLALERRIALEKQLHEERENRLAEEMGRIRAELQETQRKVQSPAGTHVVAHAWVISPHLRGSMQVKRKLAYFEMRCTSCKLLIISSPRV